MSQLRIMTPARILILFLGTLQANTPNFAVFAADGCKDMDFKVTMEGKTLANHVFETVRATDDGHCQTLCFLDDRCISYSFGISASEETRMCELSDSDHVMHPEDLVDRAGVIYRSAQNTCTCRGKQTCRYDFVHKTAKCICPIGFTGQNCEININDCFSNACFHNGLCIDHVNSYTCQCVPGTTGERCEINIDDCQSNPCVNGMCSDRINDFYCRCVPGYAGKTCDTEINECQSNPCQNGGGCQDKLNGFECTCTKGYYGSTCAYVDNCVKYPCQNGGTCNDRSSYTNGCSCPSTHYWNRCEYFNYCGVDATRCKDGSTCQNNASKSRGYTCLCTFGKYYDYSNNQCGSSGWGRRR